MKTVILLPTRSAAASVTTQAFDLNDLVRYGMSVVFTGSNVVGSLKLEASIDNVNFFDVTGSTQAITASTGQFWEVTVCGYRFVRVDWTYTSGTGNMTIEMAIKENVVRFP